MKTARLIALFILAVFSTEIKAQNNTGTKERKEVEILNAEYIRSMPSENGVINRLIGNVQFLHNNALVYCDSAYVHPNQQYEAYGHVVIIKNKSRIFSDNASYNGNTNIAELHGKIVRLEDSSAVLRTTTMNYNTKSGVAAFSKGGTLFDGKTLLESISGYYYSETKTALFIDAVQMRNEDAEITADSLYYNTQTELSTFLNKTHIWRDKSLMLCQRGWYDKPKDLFFFSKNAYILNEEQEAWADTMYYDRAKQSGYMIGNIQVLDTAKSLLAFANKADFGQSPDYVHLSENPSIAYFKKEEKQTKIDTLFLRADSIVYYTSNAPKKEQADTNQTKSNLKFLHAIKDVRIYRTNAQATCDTLHYFMHDSLAQMRKEPIIWSDSAQITAQKMDFIIKNKALYKADFLESSFVVMMKDSTCFDQIKSRNMHAFFKNSEIEKVDIPYSAQTIFFMEEDSTYVNINTAESQGMEIQFKDRSISRLKYLTEPIIDVHPLYNFPLDKQRLKGFQWLYDKRPKSRYEVCDRNIKESVRHLSSQYEKPNFPITKQIDNIQK